MFAFLEKIFRRKKNKSEERYEEKRLVHPIEEIQKPDIEPVNEQPWMEYDQENRIAEAKSDFQEQDAVSKSLWKEEMADRLIESVDQIFSHKTNDYIEQQSEAQEEIVPVTNSIKDDAAEQITTPIKKRVVPKKTVTSERKTPEKKSANPPSAQRKTKIVPKTDELSEKKTPGRRVVAPRVQRSNESAVGRRTKSSSVYIGIDFGTTFTKAAYEIAPSNVHTKYSVQFGRSNSKNAYYLPSVLYFDADSRELKISDETGKSEEIRYFKYNIISDALQKNKVLNSPTVVTRTIKERLCCVFFLSYVIHLIRNTVNENFGHIVINDNTSWYINMGVPLEAHKDDERAQLYKKVLELAYLFERKYQGTQFIDIYELDNFYVEHENESNPNLNILPEIYAEVLLYQQYLNTPAGFYTVVDIGGGTEDIATFLKTTDGFNEKVECLAQNVIGYGYDSISEKIVKSITKTSVKVAKSFLKKNIDFNNDESLQEMIPREISKESFWDARRECRTLFGSCVQRARKTRNEILQQTVSARLPMHVFVMGGACSVEFYRSSIDFMKKIQGSAGIPFFKDADVFDYVGKDTRLTIRNDQRLIISQMLAQPFEMIPEIENMPWDLSEHDVTVKGLSWSELQERQNELYPE